MRMMKFGMLALAATAIVSAPAMAAFSGAGTTIIHQLDDKYYGAPAPTGSPKYGTAALTLTGDTNAIADQTALFGGGKNGSYLTVIGNAVYHGKGSTVAANNVVARRNYDGTEIDAVASGWSNAWIQGAYNNGNGFQYLSQDRGGNAGAKYYMTNNWSNTSSDPTGVVQRYGEDGFLIDTWLGSAGTAHGNTRGSDNGGTANSGGISVSLWAAEWGPDGRYYVGESYRSTPGRISVWDDNGTDGRARFLGTLGPIGNSSSGGGRRRIIFDRFGNLVFIHSGMNVVARISMGTEEDLSDYVDLGQWGDAGPLNPITTVGTDQMVGVGDIAIDPRTGRLIAVTGGSARSTIYGSYLEFSDVNAKFRGVIGSGASPRTFVITPEPATLGLMGLGSLLLLRRRRRA